MRGRARELAVMGIMLAVMVCLTALEHMIPGLPFAPPGVKLGLSNIVTMYVLFFIGGRRALVLAGLKSGFVFMTRGVSAGILSLCGGIAAVLIILLLSSAYKKASYLLLSVAGAITHNLGQLAAAQAMLGANILGFYWPVLLASGVVMGSVTGTVLQAVMPYIKKLLGNRGIR
ncbi:MAG: Gx transporter family protein [Clostridiales bacterium]|jgi:heptaprenyl diphosphate synthase|nr:Gx transporter family protein [Clostridiales bacterium]